MKILRTLFVILLCCAPFSAPAALNDEDLPNGAVWYLHADLQEMRNTASGTGLYSWLDEEVFEDINDEFGVDLGKEIDQLTAFSSENGGTVVVIEGPVSKDTQEKILEFLRDESALDSRTHKRLEYFFVDDVDTYAGDDVDNDGDHDHSDHHAAGNGNNISIDLDDGAYISFALRNRILVTSDEEQMQELLDNKGRIAGRQSHDGALFVLTADKSFIQAGVNTDQVGSNEDNDWDSNIIRNTEQAALMISDFGGKIAVEAKLVSRDKEMAEALGGIANGLIAMQAFNSELDEAAKSLIANTRISVENNVLSLSTVLAPDLLRTILDNE